MSELCSLNDPRESFQILWYSSEKYKSVTKIKYKLNENETVEKQVYAQYFEAMFSQGYTLTLLPVIPMQQIYAFIITFTDNDVFPLS